MGYALYSSLSFLRGNTMSTVSELLMSVVAFFAMISLVSPMAGETVRVIQASGEVQGQ